MPNNLKKIIKLLYPMTGEVKTILCTVCHSDSYFIAHFFN